jgi:putative tryptophan/tyrosine transport system substrate-binding protein
MKRRAVIASTTAGLALMATARAHARTLLRVGRLSLVDSPELVQAQDSGLRELGFVEGRNIEFVTRVAGGSVDKLPLLAAELVALQVDVIVVGNNVAIAAAQRATSTIPIVMVLGVDPVGNGFIDSYARPGRNITGLTNEPGQRIHGKLLSLLKDLAPASQTVGALEAQGLGIDRDAIDAAARQLGLRMQYVTPIRDPIDIEVAFTEMMRAGAHACLVLGGSIVYANRQQVAEFASRLRLPAVYFSADYVRAGGLMSYGTDLAAHCKYSASFVARILKGEKAGDLPVEQPSRFELAINRRTARELGLALPRSVLAQAHIVIE